MNNPSISRGAISKGLVLTVAFLVSTMAAQAQHVLVWGDGSRGQTNVPPITTDVVAVAAGFYHNLALCADGTVVAWGDNSSGQTNVPPTATNIIAIAAAGNHNLALRADGTVVTWGEANNWRFPPWDYDLNMVPAAATNVVAIATGNVHNMALRSDGTVVAWGMSGDVCRVPSLPKPVGIWAGHFYSVAMQENGCCVLWGVRVATKFSGGAGLSRTLTNVVTFAAGYPHLALLADGTVGAWGSRDFQASIPASATNVVAIAASTTSSDLSEYGASDPYSYCNFALRANGSLVAWGVGAGTNVPASATNLIAVAAGVKHGLALQGDGQPCFLGSLTTRQQFSAGDPLPLLARVVGSKPLSCQWLSNGIPLAAPTGPSFTPTASLDNTNPIYQVVVSNALGSATSAVAQLVVRPLNIWGDNLNRQRNIPDSVLAPTALSAGGYHCLALNPDGTLSAWGKNVDGQTTVPADATNMVAVAAGGDHSLALRADGTVVAWGRNWDGQTDVPATAGFVAIAAGYAHNLALHSNGTVLAWGNNEFGQTNVPALLTNVVAISAGYHHSLALRSDGTVVAWGLEETVPPAATNVVAISGGWQHSLALRADGSVVAWGDNSYGQCALPPSLTNVVAISAGYYHNLALRADGTVVAWGKNYVGVTEVPVGLQNVGIIAAGKDFSAALVEAGPPLLTRQRASVVAHVGGQATLSCSVHGAQPLALQWLRNGAALPGATAPWLVLTNVQLADAAEYTLRASNSMGSTNGPTIRLELQSAPALTDFPRYQNVLIGTRLSLAPRVSGAEPFAFQWQLNGVNLRDNTRTTGTTSPTLTIEPAAAADSGTYTLLVGNASGTITGLVAQVSVSSLLAWGDDSVGQIDVPMGLSNVVKVAASGDHTLALLTDGTLAAWGENANGRNNVPLSATNIVAIAEGESHSLALRADGTVLAWGDNSYGQTTVPASASPAIAIAAGKRHSLAVLPNGTVVTWGYKYHDYWTSLDTIPASASNVVAVAAGDDFSMVLRSDGGVISWGAFLRSDYANPSRPWITNAVAIAAGPRQALALRTNGTVWALGGNYYAQSTVPPSATNVVAIAGGCDHDLTLRKDGSVVAWGGDYSGQASVPPLATNVLAVGAGAAHSLALTEAGGRLSLQPLRTSVTLGQPVVLSAGELGGSFATYQWQFNGVDLPGATTPALSLAGAYWTNAGTYQLVVSNSFGRVLGPSIVLTVLRTPLLFDSTGLGFADTTGFSGRLVGAVGIGPVVIYASNDLLTWTPIFTNPPVIGSLQFVDPDALLWNQRFYRAVEAGNQ